ncbi:MAG TPA: diguanylate cyclase [Dongiaceae bacterium]|nr:diguanylate cyclase [Dongiaceae bacterium]
MLLFRLATLILLLTVGHQAQALSIDVNDSFTEQEIGQGVEFLVDPGGELTAENANDRPGWQASTADTLNFGFSSAAYWIRFTVHNTGAQPINLMLENRVPFLDHLDVTITSGHEPPQQLALGDTLPLTSRPVRHSHFLVPLHVPAQSEVRLLLRVQSTSAVQIPLTLWEKTTFVEQDHVRSIGYGLLYGLVLSICLYHLLIFLQVRESAFLWYALVNLSLTGTFASIHGVPTVLLGDISIGINDKILLLSMAGCAMFTSLFTHEVLQMKTARPRLALALRVVVYLGMFQAALSFVLPYPVLIRAMVILVLATLATNVAAHVRRFLDGYPPARYILLAMLAAALGVVVTLLEKLGLLPSTWLTENAMQTGIIAMTLLFSFALSHRMNMDRQLRENAQAELIASQQQVNENLDRMVRERTEALEQANVQLQEASNTDALTGLRNRRYFNEAFELEFKRAFREKTSLSLLLLDIDHFKQINDSYGHPFGDLCLIQAAHVIRAQTRRPPDVAARYGGEEFVVLLPNTHEDGARHIATAICEGLRKTVISDDTRKVHITVSIGVVSLTPGPEDSTESLLKRADVLLYRAKEKGRNRVEWEE